MRCPKQSLWWISGFHCVAEGSVLGFRALWGWAEADIQVVYGLIGAWAERAIVCGMGLQFRMLGLKLTDGGALVYTHEAILTQFGPLTTPRLRVKGFLKAMPKKLRTQGGLAAADSAWTAQHLFIN